ncbi:MAG: helix-turn-helix domain-containing protein, partial [Roseobacter sp.]
ETATSEAVHTNQSSVSDNSIGIPNFEHQNDNVRDLNVHLQHEERRIIMKALDASHGVVSRAARSINIKRTTLIDKMRKHNIDWQVEGPRDFQVAS